VSQAAEGQTDAEVDPLVEVEENAESAEPVEAAIDLPLGGALEAILMVIDEPVTSVTLAQVTQRPEQEVEQELIRLAEEYDSAERGFDLRQVAGGWRFYSSSRYATVVERFITDGQQARITQASLETLAVVAYRQPVSRARISAIRGVNVDGVMRTLLARGLVEECGTEHETGAHLYRTSTYFLERLGVASLEDLPELAPYLPEIESLEAEL
jgi:segregation and condensation protein B